jgi:hypothetical protein
MMQPDLASETLCFLKKLDDGQCPKKTIMSVNFNHALFIHISTYGDLTVLVLAWLCIVRLRAIGFGVVWSGAFTQI